MKYAVIVNGIVENVIEAEPGFDIPGKALVQSDTAERGDTFDGELFKKAPGPAKDVTAMRRIELSALDGEGMDAMRKAVVALASGQPAPEEFTEYMAKVEAIKSRHPKT